LEFFPATGKENEQSKLFPQAGHSGILQVPAAFIDQAGNLGHDPRPVLADGRKSKKSFHEASSKDSGQLSAVRKKPELLYGKKGNGDRV
jgi:hypothetical protein